MEQVLPPLFIAIAACALCLGLYAIWQSLRGVFSAEHAQGATFGQSARARLVDEKAHLLQTLKDIRFERDLGKISDQDFEALNARYRARAKQVLRELDKQLGPYRGEAEALIASQTGSAESAGPTGSAESTSPSQTKDDGATGTSTQVCPACRKDNDADAVFCKACGKRLAGESDTETGSEAETGLETGLETKAGGDAT